MEGQGVTSTAVATSATQVPQATPQVPTTQADATQGGAMQQAGGVDLSQFGLTEADLQGYNSMRAEYAQLKDRYAAESPIVAQVREAIGTEGGLSKAMRILHINTLRPSEMSNEDVLVQKMMLDDPKLDERAAKLMLNSDFPDAGENEDAKILRDTRMRRSADQAREELAKLQTNVAPEQMLRNAEESARLKSAWTGILPALSAPMTIDLKDQSGQPFWKLDFNPEMSGDETTRLNQALLDFIEQNKVQPNEAGLQHVKQFRENLMFVMKRDAILKAIVDDAVADTTKRLAHQTHNSGGALQSYAPPTRAQSPARNDGYM